MYMAGSLRLSTIQQRYLTVAANTLQEQVKLNLWLGVTAASRTANTGANAAKRKARIGNINHLFRHSDKYRGFVSDRRCDSGVP